MLSGSTTRWTVRPSLRWASTYCGAPSIGDVPSMIAALARSRGMVALAVRFVFLGDDVKNLSQIWAVAPALVKLALRDDRRSQFNKEPPWKRIAEGPSSAM